MIMLVWIAILAVIVLQKAQGLKSSDATPTHIDTDSDEDGFDEADYENADPSALQASFDDFVNNTTR